MNYFPPFRSSPVYRHTTDDRQKVMHMSPPCNLHRRAQKLDISFWNLDLLEFMWKFEILLTFHQLELCHQVICDCICINPVIILSDCGLILIFIVLWNCQCYLHYNGLQNNCVLLHPTCQTA